MSTPTYIPLATVTLNSTASVTFSNIPATYRDLILVTSLIAPSFNLSLDIRLNSDSGSNYTEVRMSGSGSATSSGTATRNFMRLDDFGFVGTTAGHVNIAQLMDYSATDKQKTVLARASNANNGVTGAACRWANTSAITTITFVNSHAAGSTFSLYGIAG
jgi:hypothetical protein